ncbi:Myosin-7B [Manis pentadactyla]|nr:Myosin-7B [Manis pentadactyla]
MPIPTSGLRLSYPGVGKSLNVIPQDPDGEGVRQSTDRAARFRTCQAQYREPDSGMARLAAESWVHKRTRRGITPKPGQGVLCPQDVARA